MDKKEELIRLREDTGFNRREFADYFRIPLRTLQDWELGNRQMPDYLLRLMVYHIAMEMEKDPEAFEKWKERDKIRRRQPDIQFGNLTLEVTKQEKDPLAGMPRFHRYAELLGTLGADRLKHTEKGKKE